MTSAPTTIQFQCNACGMHLSVPVQMAGITGPCPSCQATITSPQAPPPLQSSIQVLPSLATPSSLTQTPPAYAPPVSSTSQPVSVGGAATTSSQGSLLPPRRGEGVPPRLLDPNLHAASPLNSPQPTGVPLPHVAPAAGNPAMGANAPGNDLVKGSWPPGGSAHSVLNSLLTTPPSHTVNEAQGSTNPLQQAGPPLAGLPPAKRPIHSQRSKSSGRKGGAGLLLILTLLGLPLLAAGWFYKEQVNNTWKELSLRYLQGNNAANLVTNAEGDNPMPTPATGDSPSVPVEKTAPATKPIVKAPVPPEKPASSNFDPTTVPPRAELVDESKAGQEGKNLQTILPAPNPDSKASSEVVRPAGSVTGEVDKPAAKLLTEVAPSSPGTEKVSQELVVKATPETAAAVEALKSFFAAQNWKERIKHVQMADLIRGLMEQYYSVTPDGPIAINRIELLSREARPGSGPRHEVFQVAGPGLKELLPIMVEQAPDGWKVDWLTFTEFKDSLLQRFTESFQENPARFHVMVHRTHYFDTDVPHLESKMCFEIQPPMPGLVVHAFADKGTPLADSLERQLGWDVPNAAIIAEIRWRKEDNYQWIELVGVPQFSWRNIPQVVTDTPPAPPAPPEKTVQIAKKKKT